MDKCDSLMKRAVSSGNLQSRNLANIRFGSNDFDSWVDSLVSEIDYSTVLDLCCGTGNQLVHYAKKHGVKRIVGVDISKESLDIARGRLLAMGSVDLLTLKKISIETMFTDPELARAKFDIISCFYGLYYSQDVERTLTELIDHLSLKGTILIVGPYAKNNASLFELLSRHYELPEFVVRSATIFMEQEVLPILKRFTDVRAITFSNQISYPSVSAVLDYWRASTFYSPAHEERVTEDLADHFNSHNNFVVEKNVIAYMGRKK